MRYDFKSKPLSKETIEQVWKDFYTANPQIKEALLKARQANEDTLALIKEVLSPFINSDLAKGIIQTDNTKDRLYKYWKEAGLEGTPKEAISKYLSDNASKYNTDFINYEYEKSPLENDRVARNNMLIKLIQNRLMDEETFSLRYTPGGFTNASNAARFLRELRFGNLDQITEEGRVNFQEIESRYSDKDSDPEPNYDPSDPMTIIIYNQQNQVAGKLIGVFANQNTNHAFSTLMQLFYLKKPIAFDGHLEGLFDLLHKDNYEQIDLNIAEFLAASVDAVKDPVLNFLNLNSITADAGALLARLGYSIRDIGLLFNLPIIMLICEYSFNNNVDPSIALLEVSLQYRENTNSLDNNSNKAVDLSSESMAYNIINYRKALESNRDIMEDSSFRESLLKFALLFSEILRVSSDMSLFVTSTKFTASNAVGSTFGDLYEQLMRVDKYIKGLSQSNKALSTLVMEVAMDINSPINNTNPLGLTNQEYIERELTNPFAYELAMYDMNRRLGELLNRYYPYNSPIYKSARDTLASWTKGQVLDADTINSMHTDLMSWLLAQLEDSLFNPDRPAKNGIPAREYYTKHFAMELFNVLENNPEYKSLPIFLYMQFNMDEDTDEVSVNILDVGGLMPYLKDAIRESWASLMEVSPDLARDLFMYNYYKSGFSFNPFSFMHLAPTKVKKAIRVGNGTYIDFLNKVLKGDLMNNTDILGFLLQYVRNHVDNKKLVFTPTGTTLTFIKKKSIINKVILNSFTLDVYGLGLDGDIWLLPGSNRKKRVFRPFIKIDDTLYMADNSNYGNDPNFNTSYSTAVEYRKVSILGETNKSSQYFSNSNRSLKIQAPLQADDGSTFITPDPIHDIPVFNREEEINKIIEDMVTARLKYNFDIAESINSTKSALQLRLDKMENSTLKELVEEIKNAARENGILVLDKDGNPVPSC